MTSGSSRSSLAGVPNVGGLAAEMESLRELLTMHPIWPSRLPCPSGTLVNHSGRDVEGSPFSYTCIYHFGLCFMPIGVLLHGPSGTGKTTLVRSVAAQVGAVLAYIHGPELHSPHPGEAEQALRRKFQDLQERLVSLSQQEPSGSPVGLLFIDEIDAMCPKRSDGSSSNASANPEARLVATLLTLMDGVDKKGSSTVGNHRGRLILCIIQSCH